MSRQEAIARTVIDGLVFAREGGHLAGGVPVAQLERVADALAETAGVLAWSLEGRIDAEGKPVLHLQVTGELILCCQRCLEALSFGLVIDSRLLLVSSGEEWPDDELADDEMDAVAAEREMNVLALVEDEVLLALPIAPHHTRCESPVPVVKDQEPSPFAVLAQLKN